MVALITNTDDERRFRKPFKMEAQMVMAQSWKCVGGQGRLNGHKKGANDNSREVQVRHLRSEQNEDIHQTHENNKQRQREEEKGKTLRYLEPKDTTVHTHSERCTVQPCRDINSCLKRNVARPISNMDGFVKQMHKENNQDADNLANICAQERRKIIIDRRNDSEYEASEDSDRSGCGVVNKGVDGERWMILSKIAIFLKNECFHGSRDCWRVRAHGYLRSDLVQMFECVKRQSAYQWNPGQLTESSCAFSVRKSDSVMILGRVCGRRRTRSLIDAEQHVFGDVVGKVD